MTRCELTDSLEQGAISVWVPVGEIAAQPPGIYLRQQRVGTQQALDLRRE